MLIGKVCERKPRAWAHERPSCPHFGQRVFFAAWRDNFKRDERIVQVPLCSDCYEKYVADVNRKLDAQYAKAEREAEKVFKLSEIIKRCGPMFAPVAA